MKWFGYVTSKYAILLEVRYFSLRKKNIFSYWMFELFNYSINSLSKLSSLNKWSMQTLLNFEFSVRLLHAKTLVSCDAYTTASRKLKFSSNVEIEVLCIWAKFQSVLKIVRWEIWWRNFGMIQQTKTLSFHSHLLHIFRDPHYITISFSSTNKYINF